METQCYNVEQPNSRTAEQPNSRTAEQPNSRTAEQPNSRTAEQPNSYKLKVFSFVMTFAFCACMLFLLLLAHRAGYDTKLLVKLGLQSQPKSVNWAVVGWTNTLEKMGFDSDIVFYGDSITNASDFRAFFPDKKIVNLGYPGDTISGMDDRLAMVKALSPEQVFVMGGINGLRDDNLGTQIQEYEMLLDDIQNEMPNIEICILSVLPISEEKEDIYCRNSTIEAFNAKLQDLAKLHGAKYVDLYPLYEENGYIKEVLTIDGVHLTNDAYAIWASAISEYIN